MPQKEEKPTLQSDHTKSKLRLPKINQSQKKINNNNNMNNSLNNSQNDSIIKNKNNHHRIPQLAVSNVNDIRHFLNDKNSLASASIVLVKQLRKQIDHEEFQKKIETIPNHPPNVYNEGLPEYKFKKCKTDVKYQGNINHISQLLSRAPNYQPVASNVSFMANLRSYSNSKLPQKQFNDEKVKKKIQNKNKNKDDDQEKDKQNQEKQQKRLNFNGSQSVQSLEKNWYSYGKIDRKEYSGFKVNKSYNLKDSIGDTSLFQDQGYIPSYLSYPKYTEKFKTPNSVALKHFKNCKNSDVQFFTSLRDY